MVTAGSILLAHSELIRRAAEIRLVLTDVDGVLTDTGVYVSAEGEVMKRFSIRDGMGVERLRNAGIETGIVTGERSESVARRAEKLRIRRVHLGVKDKLGLLQEILAETGYTTAQLGYIGDDVNDLGILEAVGSAGLTSAPRDAIGEVASVVHCHGTVDGGQGAFRHFADWILKLRAEGLVGASPSARP